MADVVPDPVLDARDGDSVAAQAIGALPAELSDRSDSNPAVVFLEASAYIYDRLTYQINRWPRAVIQKALALVGITILEAQAATVEQTFTLTSPQATDTPIPSGTQVSITDGSIVFATTEDATIAAYSAPAGTIAFTSGSAAVVGTGTAFVVGATWEGYKIGIQGPNGSAPTVWYTILSVGGAAALTLTTTATATASGSFYVGPVTATAAAQATTTGADTNVGAATLTTLAGSVPGISSTTNNANATGGAEEESTDEAIARASTAFVQRDTAVVESDFEAFAVATLGRSSRARAKSGYNGTTATTGTVSVATLSPTWSAGIPATTAERAAVMRDLQRRYPAGTTVVDVTTNIWTTEPAVCVVRKSDYDAATVQVNVAKAINAYLTPGVYTQAANGEQVVDGSYPWGRAIYMTDLVALVEGAAGVDRVFTANGVPAISSAYVTDMPANATFQAATGPQLIGDTTWITANQTWIVDTANNAAYLIVSFVAATSFTLDRAWAGAVAPGPTTVPYFITRDNAMNTSGATLGWMDLPLAWTGTYPSGYAGLSTDADAVARSVYIVATAS